ncbi:hypothetical protein Hanom_Chr04g00295071 [Helianthus anomalus]
MLLLHLSSSFSPKLTKLSHSNTSNFLSFTRILLASASDFTRYLISLQFLMLNSSTAPRDSITPPHTTSLSPEIRSISNLVTSEATSTRLLNIPLSHLSKFRTFNEGSASSVTSTKLGQPFISSFFKRGNTAPDHFFHPCISINLIISSDGNARPDSNNSKATTSTPLKPLIINSLSDGKCASGGRDVHLLQPLIDTCFKLRNEGSPTHFGNSNPPYDLILSCINSS